MYAEGTAAGQVSARYLRHLYRVEKLGKSGQDLRRDRRPDPPLHFARRAQSRVSVAARGCRLPAVPGLAGVPARFLLAGRQAAARRFQRHHSAQAEDHPLPGYGGSAGAAHRRGQYRLAQGRQMARHQYRCCRRHRSAVPPAASSHKASRADRRATAARRAARPARSPMPGAKISLVGRNADRVRALAKVCGAEAAAARNSSIGRHFDAVVHATPLGMFPHVNECFFDGNIPAEIVFDMVYNPLETVLDPARAGAGQDGGPGPGHVHRAGRAPVRNLDRRNRAARRHAEGRDGGAGSIQPRLRRRRGEP